MNCPFCRINHEVHPKAPVLMGLVNVMLTETKSIAVCELHAKGIRKADEIVYDAHYYDTRIDCAAIKMPDGRVWTGMRHHHCIATILQATGEKPYNGIQGFVTRGKRFVTREEAAKLVKQSSQIHGFQKEELFSEDLY